MITKSQILLHYKRKEIQEAIVDDARDKEVAIKFGDGGFGKRPDVIRYPQDVMELAKQGATSFHASEELWRNVLQIDPMMKKKDVEDLRIGWDLVLDIDCPIWKLAKITTWLMIKSLRELGISSVSLKFSGNKGFHIGVPYNAFPKVVNGVEMSSLFPEAARSIAIYLLDYISSNHIKISNNNEVSFGNKFKASFSRLKELTSKSMDELTNKHCSQCHKKITKDKRESKDVEFICPKCERSIKSNSDFMKCSKCNVIMNKMKRKKSICSCGSNDTYLKFNPLSIIEVDTILISSRHLYRMTYSFNEKSGLVSVPINPDKVMEFRKEVALPKNVRVSKFRFLDDSNVSKDEGKKLIVSALDFNLKKEEETKAKKGREYEDFEEAVPETFFPPCISCILKGLEDGKKRSLFILTNFLRSVGWSYDQIEEELIEWNKKNPEPLREVNIKGQVRYHKQKGKKILPPNCANSMYYKDLRICLPDNLCQKIKNPVNYARIKTRYLEKEKKGSKKKGNKVEKKENKGKNERNIEKKEKADSTSKQ
jgi:DNA primase catalytic subunit